MRVEWSHVVVTKHLAADHIDARRAEGESLNTIELKAMLDLVQQAKQQLALRYPRTPLDILCVDSCDINATRFGSHFESAFGPHVTVFSEHKADESFARDSFHSWARFLHPTDLSCLFLLLYIDECECSKHRGQSAA